MTVEIINPEIYQALAEMVGEDFIGEMVEAFLEESTDFVENLAKGLETKDVDLFRHAAHSIKSNAATFGALTLSELAKELEIMARENNLENANEKLEPLSLAFADASQALKKLIND